LGLKYAPIDMWGNDQIEMMFFYFQLPTIRSLYLTMLIVCKKNLNQSNLTDCKIVTIEGEGKVLLVKSLDRCQCFEIQ
jgi:hypothetical protein